MRAGSKDHACPQCHGLPRTRTGCCHPGKTSDSARRRQPIDTLLGMGLSHSAVCGEHGEHRAFAAIWRHSEQRRRHSAGAQAAWNELGRLATCPFVSEHAPAQAARRPRKRLTARIDNG
jgi:hypothetical protein